MHKYASRLPLQACAAIFSYRPPLRDVCCLLQFAIQVAIVFAKIARTDYPKEWASLFEDLTSRLQTNSVLTTRRVYLALHHILKELSSKRLAADQRSFAEVRLYQNAHSDLCRSKKHLVNTGQFWLAGDTTPA